MANTKQAAKRARQSTKTRGANMGLRTELRTAIKAVRKAIEAGDKAAAAQVFQSSVSVIDSIADKKIIHKNKAARSKSRLSAAIKAIGAPHLQHSSSPPTFRREGSIGKRSSAQAPP